MQTILAQLRYPLIQAPMAGVQDAALAIAVCQQGGLGSLSAAMLSHEQPDARAEHTALTNVFSGGLARGASSTLSCRKQAAFILPRPLFHLPVLPSALCARLPKRWATTVFLPSGPGKMPHLRGQATPRKSSPVFSLAKAQSNSHFFSSTSALFEKFSHQ